MTAPAWLGDGRRLLWVALATGLLIRIAILTQTGGLGTMIVDEQHYAELARTLLNHGIYGRDAASITSIRPPLFPTMVSLIWRLAGQDNYQAVRVANVLLTLATTGLVFRLARAIFSRQVACVAAAITWLYPSLIFFNFTLLTESLFTCLFVAFLLLIVRLVQAPKASTALACGAMLGLAALTRSVLWPFPLALCPALMLLIPGRVQFRAGLALLVLAGHVAVLSPWAIRNTRLQGVLTVVDTMGGMNLRMGNYEYTPDDRMWDAVSLTGEQNWSYALAQTQPGRTFTEGEKDKWAQRMAVAYIRAHPVTTLRRAVIKIEDFWGLEREYAAGIQQGLFSPPWWFAVGAPVVILLAYAAVATAGAAGVWLAPAAWRAHVVLLLPLLGVLAGHAIAFGHSRYHLPLMPILGIYAAALALQAGTGARTTAPWQRVGAALSICALLAIWAHQIFVVDAARIRGLLSGLLSS